MRGAGLQEGRTEAKRNRAGATGTDLIEKIES